MPRCLCTSEKPSWRSYSLSDFRLQTSWAGSEGSSPSWGNSECFGWTCAAKSLSLHCPRGEKSASFSRQEPCSWVMWAVPRGNCTSAALVLHLLRPQRPRGCLLELQTLPLLGITFVWTSVGEGSPSTRGFIPRGPDIHQLLEAAWHRCCSVLLLSHISIPPELMISIQIKLRAPTFFDISRQYW